MHAVLLFYACLLKANTCVVYLIQIPRTTWMSRCMPVAACLHALLCFTYCLQNLDAEYNMDVRVLGISGSSQMVLSEHGIDLAQWEQQYSR